jgi:hypothetical protein
VDTLCLLRVKNAFHLIRRGENMIAFNDDDLREIREITRVWEQAVNMIDEINNKISHLQDSRAPWLETALRERKKFEAKFDFVEKTEK